MSLHNKTLAMIGLALAVATVRADDVTLKDGTLLHGKITIETDDKVILEQGTDRQVITRDLIASVEKTPAEVPILKGNVLIGAPVQAEPEARLDIGSWPPVPGSAYPNLTLRDSDGKVFQLSSLRGKTILVEPVAMTCAACQALSGGHDLGGFAGIAPQDGIESLDTYLSRFAGGLNLADPNLVYVQVVIYNLNLQAPSVAEVRAWADHFHLSHRPNIHILVGTPEMLSDATFDLIPGLHLVDKNLILRSIHRGHGGGSDLYRELLPMAGTLTAKSS